MISKSSKQRLKKLKAQVGLQVPPQDNYSMQFDYNQPIAQTRQFNTMQYTPSVVQPLDAANQASNAGGFDFIGQGLPLLSGAIKVGTGIAGIIEGAKEKRRQEAYKRNAEIDLKKRMEEARQNNFYMTPYTVGRSSDYTMQQGGQVGGMSQVDLFMQFYNNQQQQLQNSLFQLDDFYKQKNKSLKTQWQEKKSQGIANTISGGLDLAKGFATMQQGGIIPDTLSILKGLTPTPALPQPLSQEEMRYDTVRDQRLRNLRPDVVYSDNIPLNIGEGNNKVLSRPRFREKQQGGYIGPVKLNPLDPGFENRPVESQYRNVRDNVPFHISNDWYDYSKRSDNFKKVTDLPDGDSIVTGMFSGTTPTEVTMLRDGKTGRYRWISKPNAKKLSEQYKLQEGGEIDENLYSENFQSPVQRSNQSPQELIQEVENMIRTEDPFTGVEAKDGFQNWLFSDPEPTERYSTSEEYFSIYGDQENNSLPISGVVERLAGMGLNPSSITGGQHNPGSAHYHGKAVDLGLNTTFGGDHQKMDAFYKFLMSPEGKQMFPEVKVLDERQRPPGQKVWSGAHLHLSIK